MEENCKVEIEVEYRSHKGKKEAKNTFYWYDAKEKKMLVLEGGHLSMRYDHKQKRMFPYVTPVMLNDDKTVPNTKEIMDWVKKHEDVFELELTGRTERIVTLSFPKYLYKNRRIDNKEQVESSLYAYRFRHEITDA